MSRTEILQQINARVKAADAILIATPEYNHSITGVLKNNIDWASRPPRDNSFNDEPRGDNERVRRNARRRPAQFHLRHIFVNLNMHAINQPQVFVNAAEQKIDKEGRIAHEQAREKIRQLLTSLISWTMRINPDAGRVEEERLVTI